MEEGKTELLKISQISFSVDCDMSTLFTKGRQVEALTHKSFPPPGLLASVPYKQSHEGVTS